VENENESDEGFGFDEDCDFCEDFSQENEIDVGFVLLALESVIATSPESALGIGN